ncbi:secretogranin-3 [Lates japonicus]|uniref:Secretogranin-3 n=1 Tax=Lates japonicus TaxID=270547 RepID=A0AAD3RLR6_LATJO|nr:secretogranin-3 [Lates japonicus]
MASATDPAPVENSAPGQESFNPRLPACRPRKILSEPGVHQEQEGGPQDRQGRHQDRLKIGILYRTTARPDELDTVSVKKKMNPGGHDGSVVLTRPHRAGTHKVQPPAVKPSAPAAGWRELSCPHVQHYFFRRREPDHGRRNKTARRYLLLDTLRQLITIRMALKYVGVFVIFRFLAFECSEPDICLPTPTAATDESSCIALARNQETAEAPVRKQDQCVPDDQIPPEPTSGRDSDSTKKNGDGRKVQDDPRELQIKLNGTHNSKDIVQKDANKIYEEDDRDCSTGSSKL